MPAKANDYPGSCWDCKRWVDVGAGTAVPPEIKGNHWALYCAEHAERRGYGPDDLDEPGVVAYQTALASCRATDEMLQGLRGAFSGALRTPGLPPALSLPSAQSAPPSSTLVMALATAEELRAKIKVLVHEKQELTRMLEAADRVRISSNALAAKFEKQVTEAEKETEEARRARDDARRAQKLAEKQRDDALALAERAKKYMPSLNPEEDDLSKPDGAAARFRLLELD